MQNFRYVGSYIKRIDKAPPSGRLMFIVEDMQHINGF